MKRVATSLFILLLIGCGIGGFFVFQKIKEDKRIEEIKKGWYIEVIYEKPINVRDEASTKGKSIGKVNKGEVYKVLDVNTESSTYFWYKIEFEDTTGWVASGRKIHWVNDVNNPTDIQVPIIKFKEDVYKVISINDINYRHLDIIEDSDDYQITHEIFHEVKPAEFIDQYWIQYTVTDKAGKSSSKVQKIEFDIKPDEAQVKDFSELKR